MSEAPERIWVAFSDDGQNIRRWDRKLVETSALGSPINSTEYVRADIHAAAIAERDEARAEVERLRGWQPISTAPTDVPHIRGLWVYSADTGKPIYWQADAGVVNDRGEFVCTAGDDFGWSADDYTHWAALPMIPEPKDRDDG